MDDRWHGLWFRAWSEPVTQNVIGFRLRPYTLGHEIALSWIRSPFVDGGNIGLADLVFAVYVCTHKNGQDAIDSLFDVKTRLAFWALGKWCKLFNLDSQVKRFIEYIVKSRWYPQARPVKHNYDSRKLGAPIPFVMLNDICNQYNLSANEVLQMPMQRACVLYYVGLEKADAIEVIGEDKLKRMGV